MKIASRDEIPKAIAQSWLDGVWVPFETKDGSVAWDAKKEYIKQKRKFLNLP